MKQEAEAIREEIFKRLAAEEAQRAAEKMFQE